MKNSYLFLFLLSTWTPSLAQQLGLSGKVQDVSSREPIAYASIALLDQSAQLIDGQLTNESGAFVFPKLKQGQYTLQIKFIGYVQKDTTLQLQGNQPIDLGTMYLSATTQDLKEVTISGARATQQHTSDRQTFKANVYKNAVGGTALDIVKNLPSASLDGNGNLTIRGTTGIIVLVNGKPSLLEPSTILSQIAANDVEQVEYISNPQSKYDPDGKAGILNLVTKKGTADGLSWVLNMQGGLPSINDYDNQYTQQRYGGDIAFQYQQDKLALQGSANYLRNDNAGFRDGDVNTIIGNKQTFFPSQGERSFDKYQYGARINATYTPSKAHEISVGALASKRYQDRVADIHYANRTVDLTTGSQIGSINYFNPNLQNKQGEFYLLNVGYQYKLNPAHTLNVGAIYEHAQIHGGTTNSNIARQVDTLQHTINTYKNPLNGVRLSIDHQWKVAAGTVSTGYQFRNDRQKGQFDYYNAEGGSDNLELIPEFTGRLNANNRVHALYSQFERKSDRWEYALGLRYEHYQRDVRLLNTGQSYPYAIHQLYPSLSLKNNLSSGWSWRMATSRRVQRTNNFELNPIPEREHSETLERGDPELLPEFVTNAEVGAQKQFGKGSMYLNVYYQHSKNPIQRVNSVYADTILHRVYTNADFAERWGTEIGGEWKVLDKVKLNGGVNLYQYSITGKILDYEQLWKNRDWVYSFNAGAQMDLKNRWSVGLQINYLSGRPTVQGYDSRFVTPHFNLSKGFMHGAITTQLQWRFIELGNWGVNEQRITTQAPDFYTTTNYVYEKNVISLHVKVNMSRLGDLLKLPKSEFGEKEF